MKKNDLLFAGIILIIALLAVLVIPKKNANIAKISVDGKLYSTISLRENQVIKINDTNIAKVENGEIFMEYASCPDKLCIHQGRISDSSKKIVCLPNKVIIEAISESDLDTVVR